MANLKLMSPGTPISCAAPPPPPPWEVVALVAHHLDPKSLATASCVSKSWYISMSSDHIWQPLCTTHYSSFSQLKFSNPSIPYCRLYAMAYTEAKGRVKNPDKPRISLEDLIFVINLGNKNNHPIINTAKPCSELLEQKGVFRFDIEVNNYYRSSSFINNVVLEDMKVSWNVVLKGWSAIFTMLDCKGQVRFDPGSGGEEWLWEELPSPRCCGSDCMSGMVADMKLEICGRREIGGGQVRVDKVSVGMLSTVNWRYVSVDNGLRYLQHFLLL